MLKRNNDENISESTWKPFLDIMMSLSLVFFLLLIALSTISKISESQMRAENAALKKQVAQFIEEKESLLIAVKKLNSELDPENQAEDMEQILENVTTITKQQAQLSSLAEDIKVSRLNKYIEIADALKEGLKEYTIQGEPAANKVEQDGTRIIIKTDEFSFESGDIKLSAEMEAIAKRVGVLMLEAIQKQEKADDSQNIVKIGCIEIVGYTDYKGGQAYNRTLGGKRSAAFVNAMLEGIEEKSGKEMMLAYGKYFKSSSMSLFNPIYGTVQEQHDEKEMAKNRRIELKINFTDDDFYELIRKQLGEDVESE